MGYTHYWEFKQMPKEIEGGLEMFKKSVKATQDCIAQVPAQLPTDDDEEKFVPFKLCGGNGKGEPKFNNVVVCFNGDAENKHDYETCHLAIDDIGFDFCKTARMPYDVAVCITLICFKHYFRNNFEYSSNGDIKNGEEGWKLAKDITSNYFNLLCQKSLLPLCVDSSPKNE